MLLHTQQVPLKEGFHINYNTDDMTYQKSACVTPDVNYKRVSYHASPQISVQMCVVILSYFLLLYLTCMCRWGSMWTVISRSVIHTDVTYFFPFILHTMEINIHRR